MRFLKMVGDMEKKTEYALMQKQNYWTGRFGRAHLLDEKTNHALCGRAMKGYECTDTWDSNTIPPFLTEIHTTSLVFRPICIACRKKLQEGGNYA